MLSSAWNMRRGSFVLSFPQCKLQSRLPLDNLRSSTHTLISDALTSVRWTAFCADESFLMIPWWYLLTFIMSAYCAGHPLLRGELQIRSTFERAHLVKSELLNHKTNPSALHNLGTVGVINGLIESFYKTDIRIHRYHTIINYRQPQSSRSRSRSGS